MKSKLFVVFIIDILLHQNGHIMLTDFDLSKGSKPPGNPNIVKSGSPHVVKIIHLYPCILVTHYFYDLATFN
jgi:hypothetical protein